MWALAITVGLNLALIFLIFTTIYDPSQDYIPLQSPVQCLKMDNPIRSICAQCITRPNNIQYDKGIFLDNKHPVTLLEIKDDQYSMSCAELLQLVSNDQKLTIESGKAIQDVIQEISGTVKNTQKPYMALPNVQKLVVYRWFGEAQTKANQLFMPNPEQVARLQYAYLWVLNSGLFLLFVLEMTMGMGIWELPLSIRWISLGLVIVLEGVCLGLGGELLADLGRVLLMVGALSRLDVEKGVLGVLLVVGALMSPSQLTYSIFVLVVYFTVLVKGLPQIRRRQVWIFLLLSYFVYTINQFIWYFLYQHASDTPCRLIELHLMTTTPLAFLAIPDLSYRSLGKSYTPYDPQNRSISLSGFEQVQDDDHQMQ